MITGIRQPEYVTRRINNCYAKAYNKVKITDETYAFMCDECAKKIKVKELDDPNYSVEKKILHLTNSPK